MKSRNPFFNQKIQRKDVYVYANQKKLGLSFVEKLVNHYGFIFKDVEDEDKDVVKKIIANVEYHFHAAGDLYLKRDASFYKFGINLHAIVFIDGDIRSRKHVQNNMPDDCLFIDYNTELMSIEQCINTATNDMIVEKVLVFGNNCDTFVAKLKKQHEFRDMKIKEKDLILEDCENWKHKDGLKINGKNICFKQIDGIKYEFHNMEGDPAAYRKKAYENAHAVILFGSYDEIFNCPKFDLIKTMMPENCLFTFLLNYHEPDSLLKTIWKYDKAAKQTHEVLKLLSEAMVKAHSILYPLPSELTQNIAKTFVDLQFEKRYVSRLKWASLCKIEPEIKENQNETASESYKY